MTYVMRGLNVFNHYLTNRENINSIDELVRENHLNFLMDDIKIKQFTFNEISDICNNLPSNKLPLWMIYPINTTNMVEVVL